MLITDRFEFPNGDILVICCEGNGGFYEVGMTPTPMEAGYSVMGWNHPGFAGSTVLISFISSIAVHLNS